MHFSSITYLGVTDIDVKAVIGSYSIIIFSLNVVLSLFAFYTFFLAKKHLTSTQFILSDQGITWKGRLWTS